MQHVSPGHSGTTGFWLDRVEEDGFVHIGHERRRLVRYLVPDCVVDAYKDLSCFYLHLTQGDDGNMASLCVSSITDITDYAVNMLDMIVSPLGEEGFGCLLGSAAVNPVPWAVLGDYLLGKHGFARHYFRTADDLYDHYVERIVEEGTTEPRQRITACQRDVPYRLVNYMAKQLTMPRNFVVSTALLFLHDLVVHCGPDMKAPLRSLFSNRWMRAPTDREKAVWLDSKNKMMAKRGGHLTHATSQRVLYSHCVVEIVETTGDVEFDNLPEDFVTHAAYDPDEEYYRYYQEMR